MWNGLIRVFFFFFSISIKLYISESPCYVAIKLLAKNFLGSHLKCQLSQLLPQLKQGRWALHTVQMFVNGFQWLPTTIFSFKNTSVYFLSEPVSTWQFFLQRNINSCIPSSLNKLLVCCCCKHRATIWLCPRVRLPPVLTQPASKVMRGLEHVQLQEWKGERNILLLLPNTMSPCILWIEAGSACTCPWAAVKGWRIKDVKLVSWHLVPISSLWNPSTAITTAAQWSWTQTTAISHMASKAFWTATCCGYIPREAAEQMPDQRNHFCTYNDIVPLSVAVVVEVLKCNFSIAFSVG